jgi:P-type conjugative transfer protein TrbG
MKSLKLFTGILLLFALSACKNIYQVSVPPESSAPATTATQERTVRPVIEIEMPVFDNPASDAGRGRLPTNEEIIAGNYENYKVTPRRATFTGGAVMYPFIKHYVYQLFAAPYKVTIVQLEAGEAVVGIVAGDTFSFMIEKGFLYEEGQKVEQVYIKALYPALKTNLIINTDRRSYNFELSSHKTLFMPIVAFNYPLNQTIATAAAGGKQSGDESIENMIAVSPEQLDYRYEILTVGRKKPLYTPSRVFNDGERTYIHFQSVWRASKAPILFEIKNGQRTLLNYVVKGRYYIVGSVVEHAELLTDNNNTSVVVIKHNTGK